MLREGQGLSEISEGRMKSGSEALGNGWRTGAGSSFSGDPLNLSPGAHGGDVCFCPGTD